MAVHHQETEEVENLQKTVASWIEAFNKKDIDALFSLYDPDSIYASSESSLKIGVGQIKPGYVAALSKISGTLIYKQEALTIEGKMGVVVVKFYIDPFEKNLTEEPFTGRAILVFRKSVDDKWLLLYDMDNTPPDVLVKDFQ